MYSLKSGKDGNIFDCPPKNVKPKKQILVRTCPPDPYLRDTSCRPNTTSNGRLIETTYKNKCGEECKGFVIETFDGECLVPINFECFCLNLTGDQDDLVSIIHEDVSDHYCSDLGRAVRLIRAARLWKGLVRTARGTVRCAMDTYGNIYHQIVDSRELDGANVVLIVVHTMGVSNDLAYMSDLEGQTVDITYVDFGVERPGRCGIPITILQLEVVESTE